MTNGRELTLTASALVLLTRTYVSRRAVHFGPWCSELHSLTLLFLVDAYCPLLTSQCNYSLNPHVLPGTKVLPAPKQ